jgi:hypothetical protein
MKRLAYIIPSLVGLSLVHAEVTHTHTVDAVLKAYGEAVLREAEFEFQPFKFLKEAESKALNGSLFSTFDSTKNTALIVETYLTNRKMDSGLLLEKGVREKLYPSYPSIAILKE